MMGDKEDLEGRVNSTSFFKRAREFVREKSSIVGGLAGALYAGSICFLADYTLKIEQGTGITSAIKPEAIPMLIAASGAGVYIVMEMYKWGRAKHKEAKRTALFSYLRRDAHKVPAKKGFKHCLREAYESVLRHPALTAALFYASTWGKNLPLKIERSLELLSSLKPEVGLSYYLAKGFTTISVTLFPDIILFGVGYMITSELSFLLFPERAAFMKDYIIPTIMEFISKQKAVDARLKLKNKYPYNLMLRHDIIQICALDLGRFDDALSEYNDLLHISRRIEDNFLQDAPIVGGKRAFLNELRAVDRKISRRRDPNTVLYKSLIYLTKGQDVNNSAQTLREAIAAYPEYNTEFGFILAKTYESAGMFNETDQQVEKSVDMLLQSGEVDSAFIHYPGTTKEVLVHNFKRFISQLLVLKRDRKRARIFEGYLSNKFTYNNLLKYTIANDLGVDCIKIPKPLLFMLRKNDGMYYEAMYRINQPKLDGMLAGFTKEELIKQDKLALDTLALIMAVNTRRLEETGFVAQVSQLGDVFQQKITDFDYCQDFEARSLPRFGGNGCVNAFRQAYINKEAAQLNTYHQKLKRQGLLFYKHGDFINENTLLGGFVIDPKRMETAIPLYDPSHYLANRLFKENGARQYTFPELENMVDFFIARLGEYSQKSLPRQLLSEAIEPNIRHVCADLAGAYLNQGKTGDANKYLNLGTSLMDASSAAHFRNAFNEVASALTH